MHPCYWRGGGYTNAPWCNVTERPSLQGVPIHHTRFSSFVHATRSARWKTIQAVIQNSSVQKVDVKARCTVGQIFNIPHRPRLYWGSASWSHPPLSRRNNEQLLTDLVSSTRSPILCVGARRGPSKDPGGNVLHTGKPFTQESDIYSLTRISPKPLLRGKHAHTLPSSVRWTGTGVECHVMHYDRGPVNIVRIDAGEKSGIRARVSSRKSFAILRMIRRTFSRITRMDFQILYGAYVRPLLEYANQVVYSGRTKDVTPIERV
ncbi:hypothetical protein T265_00308 [Opisthorchis viverrini]|uniref:Uncharacterized protein n=1 Tax=Opisthorchis viverrini TaxID=6198 RepID=A0A075A3B4_OPIVI|nr:hypothetical protein T265_00308 [Opisthorchis viverrini]KER33861.1 hypothetical protein T265_00308 [Opisthorchis viverrini]